MAGEGKKVKWIRYVLLAVVGLGLYHILSGPSGALNLLRLHRENERHKAELDSLEARKRELEIEKVRLQNDSAYLEKVARKELGMAKPGEKVFRYMAPDESRKKKDPK
jgi:cell division protein FtsB